MYIKQIFYKKKTKIEFVHKHKKLTYNEIKIIVRIYIVFFNIKVVI